MDLEIRSLAFHAHRCPLRRPFVTAQRRTEAVEYVVAEVELADGTRGQGSAAETRAVTGEDAWSIMEAIDGPLRAALVGSRGAIAELSEAIGAALPRATSAKAAVDVALHDAWARSAGRPLVELLGGDLAARSSIVDDMTVSLEDPETMARRAREAADGGAGILKIKLGRDAAEDRRRLDAVLEAVPEARLRLDANQGWDAAQAIAIITAMERDGLPVDLVEQPVPARDLDALARVTAAVSTPIMADESLWTPEDAREIIDRGAADLLNIKLAKTGSLRRVLDIADLAAEAGLECMVGAMMEPRISITAAAHVALAHPAITMIDLDAPAWFASAEPAGGFEETGGVLRLLGGPGLGLEPLSPDTEPLDGGPR